jgi:RNA polymerase sigma-70 factor (ECF subfamily)
MPAALCAAQLATEVVDRHQDDTARGKESGIDENGPASIAGPDPGPAELSESEFGDAARRYRREQHVYCYRMLGSFDDAEDHVQEALLRAWRSRDSFQRRAGIRAWLYRIATNVCLDTLRRHRRAPVPPDPGNPNRPSAATMPWLQPYPDALLGELVSDQPGPEAQAVTRESVSLAYLTAIQLLPPRQRAVLILRDVLDWPASEVAAQIDSTVPAVKSALQRARATLGEHRAVRAPAPPAAGPAARRLLQGFIAAHERADPEALIALLREDVRLALVEQGGEWNGRPEVAAALRDGMTALGAWRVLATSANGQPAAAGYLRRPGDTVYRPFAISVLDIDGDRLAQITAFEVGHLITAFGLPASL